MRAVYESKNPYAQVGYWDVNGVTPVKDLYTGKKITGIEIQLPDNFSERTHFYHFYDGEKHNQLTLTDPTEIQNMREWVKYHSEFREVYYEADPVEEIPEPEQEEHVEALVDTVEEDPDTSEGLSDWDKQMISRLRQ